MAKSHSNNLKYAQMQLEEAKAILAHSIVGSDQYTLDAFNSFLLKLNKYEKSMQDFLDDVITLNENLKNQNQSLQRTIQFMAKHKKEQD